MKASPALLAFLGLFALVPLRGEEVPGNRFVYTQVRHGGQWDPYPGVWDSWAAFLRQSTSVDPWPERRVLGLDDPGLFESPFAVLLGRGAVSLTEGQLGRLRDYLAGGGFLLIDDSEAERNSAFARSLRDLPDRLFPGSSWKPVPEGHAVFRAYFLLRGAAGRRAADPGLKGLFIQDRLAAVFSANDLHGAWARDPMGHALFACEPGGELQRQEAMKLSLNLSVFSLTGTYKTDAVHQPFLEEKMRR